MTHRSLPENEQLLAIRNAMNSCPNYVESLALLAGSLEVEGIDRYFAVKETIMEMCAMDEVNLSRYMAPIAKTIKIQKRVLERLIKEIQEKQKNKDTDEADIELILSGHIDGWFIELVCDPQKQENNPTSGMQL